jgi:hypothetical protein
MSNPSIAKKKERERKKAKTEAVLRAGYSSMIEHLPNITKLQGLIPSTMGKKKKWKKRKVYYL